MSLPDHAEASPDPSTGVLSWLNTVIDWLRTEEPVLSAAAVLTVAVVGVWRLLRRAASRRQAGREVQRRLRFADHIESQLRRLDEKEVAGLPARPAGG